MLPISVDALNHLGVDGDGNLYWHDTKILTSKKEFKLSWFQGTLATITAASALIAAIAASVTAYVDFEQAKLEGNVTVPAKQLPRTSNKG